MISYCKFSRKSHILPFNFSIKNVGWIKTDEGFVKKKEICRYLEMNFNNPSKR